MKEVAIIKVMAIFMIYSNLKFLPMAIISIDYLPLIKN